MTGRTSSHSKKPAVEWMPLWQTKTVHPAPNLATPPKPRREATLQILTSRKLAPLVISEEPTYLDTLQRFSIRAHHIRPIRVRRFTIRRIHPQADGHRIILLSPTSSDTPLIPRTEITSLDTLERSVGRVHNTHPILLALFSTRRIHPDGHHITLSQSSFPGTAQIRTRPFRSTTAPQVTRLARPPSQVTAPHL